MKNTLLFFVPVLLLVFTGCKKDLVAEKLSTSPDGSSHTFINYVIPKGEHYSLGNSFKAVDVSIMRFTVRFDSSCIYQTADPKNQDDINKLYGFADNGAAHQQFSARFGWRWSNGALRLFAYIYNSGERSSKEITAVPIGKEIACSIRVAGDSYIFSVGEKVEAMARQSTTPTAKGYQLYPYFGGDETAPHEVRIWIREE
jgi:hypothetical protein